MCRRLSTCIGQGFRSCCGGSFTTLVEEFWPLSWTINIPKNTPLEKTDLLFALWRWMMQGVRGSENTDLSLIRFPRSNNIFSRQPLTIRSRIHVNFFTGGEKIPISHVPTVSRKTKERSHSESSTYITEPHKHGEHPLRGIHTTPFYNSAKDCRIESSKFNNTNKIFVFWRNGKKRGSEKRGHKTSNISKEADRRIES